MKTAIYARVSTFDQEPENQLRELRRYVEARGWTAAVEYVDKGVSGSKDKRPALLGLQLDHHHMEVAEHDSVTVLDEVAPGCVPT